MGRPSAVALGLAFALGACRSSDVVFIPGDDLDDTEILLVVVASEDELDLSRSRVVLPKHDLGGVSELTVEEHESLVLASLDLPSLQRGARGAFAVAPGQVSLHPASGFDCGDRGANASRSDSGEPRVRQALHRFEPRTQIIDPGASEPRPLELRSLPALGELELELPADPDDCRAPFRLELTPFTEGGIFANGFDLGTPGLDLGSYTRVNAPIHYDADRWFMMSGRALFLLRRGVAFDPAVDPFLLDRDLGLEGPTGTTWIFTHVLVFGEAPSSERRIMIMLREFGLDLEEEAGWAVVETRFDGHRFHPPTLRWRYGVQGTSATGGAALAVDYSGAIVAAGMEGSWAVADSLDADFVGGSLDRGDFEAVIGTPDGTAPHLVAIRGGNLGLGDMRTPEALEIYPLRPESSAISLNLGWVAGEENIYSGWKDGRVYRSKLSARPLTLEPLSFEVPRRLERCARSQPNECGRVAPVGWSRGLRLVNEYGREPILVGVFSDCPSVLVHHLRTGCTSTVEFADQDPSHFGAVSLSQLDDAVFVTDGNGEPFELKVIWP